jgi:Uma2 family endonuclease
MLSKKEKENVLETEITKKLFTVEEYHRMGEAGILREGDRIELIDGEVIQMSPIGHKHVVCVTRVTTSFIRTFESRAVVGPGSPVRLSKWTEPEPDIVVFKPRADFYAEKRPTAEDIFFIVEVADSSLTYDRKIKLPLYARAGIREVWIEDLAHDLLYVHRNPVGEDYGTILILRSGDSVSPLAFPDIVFRVDELLSTDYNIV